MSGPILPTSSLLRRAIRAMVLAALPGGAMTAAAAPLLHCEVEQGGRTWQVETAPVTDPYGVRPLDVDGKFRFKAVMVGDEHRVEYVKLYAYYQTRRKPVLLHQATYLAPVAASSAAPSLTGEHTVFSPWLEREMRYRCTLREVAR